MIAGSKRRTGNGTRTHTAGKGQEILSLPCLPFHHSCISSRTPRGAIPDAKLISFSGHSKFSSQKATKKEVPGSCAGDFGVMPYIRHPSA